MSSKINNIYGESPKVKKKRRSKMKEDFVVKRNSLGTGSTRVPTYSLAGGETGHFCHKL